MSERLTDNKPWSDLDYYLTQDHAARRKTTFIVMVSGMVIGTILQAIGSSFRLTALVTLGTVGIVEIGRALTYERVAREIPTSTPAIPLRRTLLLNALYAVVMLVLGLLRIPRAEARIVERRIEQASVGPPPFDNLDKLVQAAIQDDISINLGVLHAAQSRVLAARAGALSPQTKHSVSVSLSQLLGYEVYIRSGVKLRVPNVAVAALPYGYRFRAPVFPHPGQMLAGASREDTAIIVDLEDQQQLPETYRAAFVFKQMTTDSILANFTATNQTPAPFSDPALVLKYAPQKVVVLDVTAKGIRQPLDGIVWVSTNFENSTIVYAGGELRLQDVTFRDCQFVAKGESAAGTMDYLRSQGTNPVTLTRG